MSVSDRRVPARSLAVCESRIGAFRLSLLIASVQPDENTMEEESHSDDGDAFLSIVGIGLVVAIVVALGLVGLGLLSGAPSDPPVDANWTLERINDSQARITLEGGGPVDQEHVVVTVDSVERQLSSSGVLFEGDSVTFEARQYQVVRLYWDDSNDNSQILRTWRPERP